MESNEIKNAWNLFKKEVKKETGIDLSGCCYMNKKQIENGTATICLCNGIPFDDEIKFHQNEIKTVSGYVSWTDEEKARSIESSRKEIERIESEKAKYGTKENAATVIASEIFQSNAFQKLAGSIHITSNYVELISKWAGLGAYQIRVHY